MNKILDFDRLKEYAAGCGDDSRRLVERYWKRAQAKTVSPATFWEKIYPKAEVVRLRAFIKAMREEEHFAAKNALDLYAENELLKRYKDYANGLTGYLVPSNEHGAVVEELRKTREKMAVVSRALDDQMRAWNEYMINHPVPKVKK